jgi:uncharacterized protein (DUF58 family)
MSDAPSPNKLLAHFDQRVLSTLNSLDLKARYIVEGFLNGLHRSPFHGLSVEFSEYRDYYPGDDLRHLDWRLYGRSDRLYIKKYTQETNVRVYLVIDTSASMIYRGKKAWGTKLEVASILGAALTMLLLGQNDAVGLLSLDDGAAGASFIRPSQKPSQLGLILHHLQALQPAGGPRLGDLLEHVNRLIHRRSFVLFFSDLLEPAAGIKQAFQQLRFHGHECLVFQVLDHDEMEFPFDETSVFEGLETPTRRRVDPKRIRQQYLKRFRSFMKEHDGLFQSLEIPHSVVLTHEDPCTALSAFLLKRERLL